MDKLQKMLMLERELKRPGILSVLHTLTALTGVVAYMTIWGLTLISFFVLGTPYVNFTTSLFLLQLFGVAVSVIIFISILARLKTYGLAVALALIGAFLYVSSIIDRGVYLGYMSAFTYNCNFDKGALTLDEYVVCTQNGTSEVFAPAYTAIMWAINVVLLIHLVPGIISMVAEFAWLVTSRRPMRGMGQEI